MRYVKINKSTYILFTTQGCKTVTRQAFNFNKIERLIKEGAGEDKILPLLEPPSLPEGVYIAYLDAKTDTIRYTHTVIENSTAKVTKHLLDGSFTTYEESDEELLGYYASREDIANDWPEYLI